MKVEKNVVSKIFSEKEKKEKPPESTVNKATILFQKNKELIVTALTAVGILILVVCLLGYIFKKNFSEIISLQPFYLMIGSLGVVVLISLVNKKDIIPSLNKVNNLFFTTTVVMIISILAFGKWGNPASSWVSSHFSKSPKPLNEYGFGEYEINLKNGEESEWINFKSGMKFDYVVSTKNCKNDSLVVIYSDASQVEMWGKKPLQNVGRNTNKEARIKFKALSDLEKIKFKVIEKT